MKFTGKAENRRPFSVAFLYVLLGLFTTFSAHGQHGAPAGEWPAYSGDRGSTKYSALDRINAANAKDLAVAWR